MRVWNRSPEKARALAAEGAEPFDDPAEAARGAVRVHLTLSDDVSVDEVLERARPGLGRETIIVDHTTTSPAGAAARMTRWAELGIAYQHVPVFMAPQHALESSGVMLISGDQSRYEALAPELSKMTGKLIYLGPEPERGASMKLLGNLFLISMTGGLADVFALAKALGVPAGDAKQLFDFFNPAITIGARANRMLEGDYAHPSWELAMARKDARLMMEAAARGASSLMVIPGVAQAMDRWIEKGHAKDDWMVIGKDGIR